jgi:ABC-type antimicrobial peptide transport system permease subunit
VQPDWFEINGWQLASGDGFDARAYTGAAKSVILGETVRRELFGDEDPLGQTIRIGRVPFTVVGTLKPKGRAASARTRTTSWWCRWKPRAAACSVRWACRRAR